MRATLIVIGALALFAPSPAGAETKTTVYTYNADGALTSITETTEGTPGSTTTYFTWDNFEADPNMPSTGTVTAANGNLVGYGPSPGDASEWSGRYDLLDRLVHVTNERGDRAVYEYHPDEVLAASINANDPLGDGLQHYYDQSRDAQVTNLYDRHTGELSSRHHRIRYLEDGTEQILVRHRKDVDGVYNLGDQTMSAYAYDPYGASLELELTGSPPAGPVYSLRDNPYRYSNELRDPVSGADYLRARWYQPGHQTFLQRDPVRNLNRYGYANGNPVTNYDPGGTSIERFARPLEQFAVGFASSFVHTFTSGLGLIPVGRELAHDGLSAFADGKFDLQLLQAAAMIGGAVTSLYAGYWNAWADVGMRGAPVATTVQAGLGVVEVASGTILGAQGALQAARTRNLSGFAGGLLGGFVANSMATVGTDASLDWLGRKFGPTRAEPISDSTKLKLAEGKNVSSGRLRRLIRDTEAACCGHFVIATLLNRFFGKGFDFDVLAEVGQMRSNGLRGMKPEYLAWYFRAEQVVKTSPVDTVSEFLRSYDLEPGLYYFRLRKDNGVGHAVLIHLFERDGRRAYRMYDYNDGFEIERYRVREVLRVHGP